MKAITEGNSNGTKVFLRTTKMRVKDNSKKQHSTITNRLMQLFIHADDLFKGRGFYEDACYDAVFNAPL